MSRSLVVSYGLGAVCLSLLGFLPGCGGEATVNPTGSGGAGGEGAGDGGQGGSGASSITGGGGTTGTTTAPATTSTTTAPQGCSPPCGENHACVDQACQPILQVELAPTRARFINLDGSIDETGSIAACERPLGVTDVKEVLAVEGDCRVEVSPWPEGPDASLTAATATAPSFGTALLEPSSPAFCWTADVTVAPSFLSSEAVHFAVESKVTGTTFEMEAQPPPPLTMQAGPLKKGDAYTIDWVTPGAPPVLYVLQSGSDVQITCRPTTGTSIVIPGSLTAMLDSMEGFVAVAAVVRATPNVLELTPSYRASAGGGRTELRLVQLVGTP